MTTHVEEHVNRRLPAWAPDLAWPVVFALVCCAAALPAAEGGPLEARKPERQRWSWNQPQAEITPTGDLKWKPEPFKFEAGQSTRYIDGENGDDSKAGDSKESAWKHHPWDANATGNAKQCKGTHTYVFKRGVIYRGALRANESGAANAPIRLSSDPAWGTGEALFYGSERVTGWKRGAENKDIPEGDKVWYADLSFAPRCVWEVKDKEIERIALARTPNWKVSNPEDVMSEWWTWEQPEWWAGRCKINGPRGRAHIGIDSKHLTKGAEYYKDAVVRTEYGIVMGTPFPTRVEAFDAARKGVVFQGIWFGDSETIITNNRYFLEDKAQYLDEPGEFWFEKKGAGGRLYLRLSGDRDPNQAVVEAARHINLIESDGLSHVQITGLTFRFTNIFWDLTPAAWGGKDINNACIRVLGSAEDLRVANCRFEHAGKAIRISAAADSNRIDRVVICDNEMQYLDHGAIQVEGTPGKAEPPAAYVGDVKVLRNRLFTIGLRAFRQDHSHALCVSFPETMEVAGNVLDRCYGAGLFLFGGKGGGETRDTPLTRDLIYNNRVTDALLAANDWGAIETWQGGPHYVYNNISGNPNGYWNWAYSAKKPGSGRLGFAYYLDGSFKNYLFNNVAWGNNNDLSSKLCNNCAFYEAVPSIYNTFFNNTVYKFAMGSNWSPAGGRQFFLGNLWMDISSWVFQHGQLKEDKKAATPAAYPHETMAYGRNVFYGVSPQFAVFEASGKGYADLASFKKALEEHKPLAMDGGMLADAAPVANAAEHDFRPKAGSAAIDQGVKLFVPWALYGMVAEWNFRRNNSDPTVLLDDHWYMAPYYTNRDTYYKLPTFPLKAVNVTAADYVDGPLENWTQSALQFNGKDQYASISQQELAKPVSYELNVKNARKQVTVSGKDLATPDIATGNFLIEAYLKTQPGHSNGVIVSKMGPDGYCLAVDGTGGVELRMQSGGKKLNFGAPQINDGKWHHAIAEVDRAARRVSIYLDGKLKLNNSPIGLAPEDSLANSGDLSVGKGPEGNFFAGAIDFLRIARGTLADAKTSIEELYDWQFDGPFLRDFRGREVSGKCRDAGAFEYGGE